MPPVTTSAPCFFADFDEIFDLLETGLVDERPHVDFLLTQRITETRRLHRVGQRRNEFVGDLALHIDAFGGIADLPCVEGPRRGDEFRSFSDVSVLVDDRRRLAAELKVDLGDVRRGGLHDR